MFALPFPYRYEHKKPSTVSHWYWIIWIGLWPSHLLKNFLEREWSKRIVSWNAE